MDEGVCKLLRGQRLTLDMEKWILGSNTFYNGN